MPLASATLVLNEQSIDVDELALGTLPGQVDPRERPALEVQVLMQAMQRRCQAQGHGWWRPWNKTGMRIFRAHRHVFPGDGDVLHGAMEAIRDFAPEPLLTLPFIEALLRDPALMAFTFYHNRVSVGAHYEGLTISFGRQAPDEPGRRDRVDIILEDCCADGRVDGHVDLVRIIVCPWSTYGVDRDHQRFEQCEFSDDEQVRFDALYRGCLGAFHAWKRDESRQWSHWSADYLEFFGPRAFVPHATSFT